ncbi:MAG: methyltransferase domain-containing protein [Prevotella sp.]|nr:methyltransferase domain-containing protein [Prevotella sp.]MBR6264124.1 methyltransferase domain-containing protein [Prevotella sp.]
MMETNKSKNEKWWIDFFKGDFTEVVLNQQAAETVSFMQQTGQLRPGMKVFDQCCGKGYLAHELDAAGLRVTGIDISEPYIEYARTHLASPRAEFVLGDAETFHRPEEYDISINWNTSFGYNEDDGQNERMLVPFSNNLKRNGQFFFSTMNPLFINKHFQRFIVKQVPSGDSTIITIRESRIEDGMMKSDWLIVHPDGHRETAFGQTKLYSVEQFQTMFLRHGLQVEQVYGDISLSPYDEDHPSMILYGHKV